MGMTTQCPQCGMTFIIPTVQVAAPQAAVEQAAVEQPAAEMDVYSQPYVADPTDEAEPEAEEEAAPASSLLDELQGDSTLLESAAANIVHIPCPNGHILEAASEDVGLEVLCPHCYVQFRLRTEDSLEYRAARSKIEQRQAKLWFNWAIAAAVVVGIGLLTMIIYMISAS